MACLLSILIVRMDRFLRRVIIECVKLLLVLADALREAQNQNKDLSRQVQELTTIRVQLQNERDGLSAELSETKDALKDALALSLIHI